ncbi:MAG: hypothetical protein CMK72_19065 [Pseudomonadaceae bacterium]|jgi:hypothetical protein|uniref:DUF2092 domain-containing protein n=1 Tax=Pseudomonas sp. TaxID=306 RepID=UPI000C0E893E|nr:DUF2092 domain-containing protein [Pseudomonas sp.]MBQ56977.1 hypothetical protein [Pseudomonadaceae bacterium]
MKHPLRTGICLFLALPAFVSLVHAAEDADAEGPAVTPEAKAVYDRMSATLKGLKQYSVTVQSSQDEVLNYGYKLQHNANSRLDVEPPNHLFAEVGGSVPKRYVYDGKTLTLMNVAQDYYAQTQAPDSLGGLVDALINHDVEVPLMDFLSQSLQDSLLDGVKRGRLIGTSQLDGKTCDHLAFREPDVDWQLWVSQGKEALPCKIVITTRYTLGDPQYQAVLKWNTSPGFKADHFTFVPGKDATRIPFTANNLPASQEEQP